jgi:hypothetical protein
MCGQAHRRAWVPSLPDCRSPHCLPAWLLTAADAAGALLGPLVVAMASAAASGRNDTHAGDPASIIAGGGHAVVGAFPAVEANALPAALAAQLYFAAAAGLFLCVLSACFGA